MGVPFVEADLGGWDNHAGIFATLENQKLPELDKAMSALVEDLNDRGLLQDTAIIWMGDLVVPQILMVMVVEIIGQEVGVLLLVEQDLRVVLLLGPQMKMEKK
jgi:hypothetical protein